MLHVIRVAQEFVSSFLFEVLISGILPGLSGNFIFEHSTLDSSVNICISPIRLATNGWKSFPRPQIYLSTSLLSGHCHRGQQYHFTLSCNQSTGYSIIVFTVHIDSCTIGLLRGSIICTIRFDLTGSGCHRHRVIFTSCRLFNCSNQSPILSAISS